MPKKWILFHLSHQWLESVETNLLVTKLQKAELTLAAESASKLCLLVPGNWALHS
jgi:hypothetical protein